MENTLNKKSVSNVAILGIALLTMLAFAIMFVSFLSPANASGWISQTAGEILSDLGIVIALAAVVAGVMAVIKGQTSKAIIAFVIGAIFAAIAASKGTIITNAGDTIFKILNLN